MRRRARQEGQAEEGQAGGGPVDGRRRARQEGQAGQAGVTVFIQESMASN